MSQQLNSLRVPLCARRFNLCCAVLAALLFALVLPRANAQAACNVLYTTSPQNASAFGAAITIENTGTTALSSWKLTWSFANGQTVAELWNGIASQSGANVTVTNEPYNGSIPAGGSLSGIGFNGTWNGSTNAVPTSFAVNGVTCGGSVATGSFTLKPSASALSIAQSASGTDTVSVTDVSPFAGSVTLAASGLPAGVTAAFGTNPTTGSSVLTLTASSAATAGTSTVTITGTSGSLTASTTIALTVTAAATGSFTLKPSASALSIAQSASGTDTIAVTDVSPFAGSVTLAASGLPAGVTAAFGTNPTTGSSVLTLTASSAATAGTSTVTITGTSGTLTASTTIALTVTAAASSGACQVLYTISPQNSSAFGAAITLENTSATAWSNWTLTWSFANGQTVGALWNGVESQSGANVTVQNESYNGSVAAGGSLTGIGFNGTWNGVTNAVPTNFAVNGTACNGSSSGSGSFSLKPTAATLAVAEGASATDTLTVTDVSPFAGSVTLAASGLPSGVTAAFATNPTTGSSVVTFTATSTATTGTSTVTITGTSGALTASTTIALTVTAAGTGSFTLKPSASALSIAQSASGTDTIAVTDVSPFSGSVTLAASGLPSGVTAAFATNPTTGSSVLTLTASSTATAGTSTITITGTSGALTASTTVALTVSGAGTTTTVAVDQASSGPAITNQILGMNMAAWYDIVGNQSAILSAFETAGIKAVRWPGGSWSDVYHWQTNTNCQNGPDGGGTPDTTDTFANFVSDIAIPAGVDVALTADYGSNPACTGGGEPSEAAAWVTAALADGITVSHMTVGNEVYGSWEEDLHSSPNNAATYAAAVIGTSGYYQAIKAASPNTLVGVVVDDDNTTGGWDNTVLANAKGSYDFVEYHYYPEAPGLENDTTLINQDAQQLTTNINSIKAELTKWGTPNTPIYVGEMGSVYSNPGKQSMSITQALFAGQVLGEMMNDGVSRSTWWIAFGGCADSTYGANFSTSLYGWQSFGGYMVFSDGLTDYYECTNETLAAGTLLPTARVYQLFSKVAVNGESVLSTSVSGDTTDVVAYAATNEGGTALVLFNRNENASEPVTVTLSAQSTASTVTVETYDKAIYDLSGSPTGTPADPAGTSTWAPPTTTTVSSPTLPLTLTLAPWSMNVVMIH